MRRLCVPAALAATSLAFAVGPALSQVAPPQRALSMVVGPPTDAPQTVERDQVTIVIGGDIGLGGTDEPVHADGGQRHGKRYAFDAMTRGLAPLINGDINFANLETVVTDRNDLAPVDKTFNFRSHPVGVAHLVALGFNVFSTANNHAIDYGEAGIRETRKHLNGLPGLKASPGTGIGYDDAARPHSFPIKGATFAVSAIGIGGSGVRPGQAQGAAMLNYASASDFKTTIERLAAHAADYRILSVHYGAELAVRPQRSDVARLRDEAVLDVGIDLVIGHHAHVAAGAARVDGKLIFFGLGNLLHPGMQDMGRMNACRDYGLMARVTLQKDEGGKWVARAVEAIPLTNMHLHATPLTGEAGQRRIAVLNHLARDLDDRPSGTEGLRFQPQADGRGLYCAPGSEQLSGAIGAQCRAWQSPAAPTPAATRMLDSLCGDGHALAARRTAPSPDRASSPVASAAPRAPVTINFTGDR